MYFFITSHKQPISWIWARIQKGTNIPSNPLFSSAFAAQIDTCYCTEPHSVGITSLYRSLKTATDVLLEWNEWNISTIQRYTLWRRLLKKLFSLLCRVSERPSGIEQQHTAYLIQSMQSECTIQVKEENYLPLTQPHTLKLTLSVHPIITLHTSLQGVT